jgi:hypothetical protein
LRVGDVDIESKQRYNDHFISVGPTDRIAAVRRSRDLLTAGRSTHAGHLRSDVGHHFLCDERFDLITDLHVVEVLYTDTALIAAGDFRRIVLEAFER